MLKRISDIFQKTISPSVNKNGFFDDFYEDFSCGGNRSLKNGISPRFNTFSIDVIEDDNNYIVRADLPGFIESDIKVRYDSGFFTILGYKDSEDEQKENNYIRKERCSGEFRRSFSIDGINEKTIKVYFKNGVLKVILEKL